MFLVEGSMGMARLTVDHGVNVRKIYAPNSFFHVTFANHCNPSLPGKHYGKFSICE